MESTPQPVLDTREAAKYVGLAPSTLETLRVRGGGPRFLKIRRAVRYRFDDLEAWLSGCERRSTSDLGTSVGAEAP
jgi:excisionase family DNA binding protein